MRRTQPVAQDRAPQRRAERLVVSLLTDLLRVDGGGEVRDVLHATLARLGEACGFERTFLFHRNPDADQFGCLEWGAAGVASLIPDGQQAHLPQLAGWHSKWAAGQTVFVADARALDEGLAEKALMVAQGARSALMVPMLWGGRLTGVLGYHLHRPAPCHPREAMLLFSALAEAIGAVLHRADVAAAAARDRLATAVEALSDGFVLFDAEDRLALFNRRCVAMFPALADQFRIGARYEDMARAALERGLLLNAHGREDGFLAEMLASHRGEAPDTELWMNDGRILRVKENVTADGGRVGLLLDVTAERQSEQRLAHVINGAQVGTWEYDRRSRTTQINDRWAGMLGYSRAELEPMTLAAWENLLHPDDYAAMLAAETVAHAKGQWAFDFQLRVRHRDGHWVWVQSRGQVVQWDAKGQPMVLAGVHLDITEAKALEISLLRERDTLATLMETSICGITVVDAGGRIVFANHEAEAVLGRSLHGTMGHDFDSDAWGISDLAGQPIEAAALPVAQVLATRCTVRDFRHRIRGADGTERVLSINAAPLATPGADLAVVCSVMDITDMIHAEAALHAAIAKAEAANRAKSEFLATMSHEIRTPLNGVLGMAEVLASQLVHPEHLSMVQVIRQSGEHLLAVINDILDLAQIESGRLSLDVAPLRPSELAARIEALHGVCAREKGVVLTVEASVASSGWRMGDAKRVMQILHNLVGNAVKFTDHGQVLVRLTASAAEVVIEVSDSGIGMDPARIEDVFGDFAQGEGGIARRFGGSGLGLPITRRLTLLMGGQIALHTAPGQGFCARVTLPLPRFQSRTAGPQQVAPPLPALPPLRILVAEDNATNRVILRAMLDCLGVSFVQVTDGDEAVDTWAPRQFDLLLFDIAMPRKDGLAALHDIALKARAAGVAMPPALAVTANAMLHHVDEYLAAGFAACIAKPMRLEDLAQAIAAALPAA